MPSIQTMFETTVNVIRSLTDDNKPPLHVGEAMACWTYMAFVAEIINFEEVGLNMTVDKQLIEMIKEALQVAQSHKKEIGDFMRREGIALPTQPQPKSKSDPSAVPAGAKFTDSELANAISINFVTAADMCAAAASQSLRTDVGLLFLKFQLDKLTLGFKIKNMMYHKGWLKIPPAYNSPGLPNP